MEIGDYRDGYERDFDALDERYLIDRAEHEAHAEGNEEKPDEPDDEPAPPLCGAVAHLPSYPQDPCRKPAEHVDIPGDYHSNGLRKWPVDAPEPYRLTLTELIDELADASVEAAQCGYVYDTEGEIVASARAVAAKAEIDRRIALAQADHSLIWKSHLDNNARSRRRQASILRYARRHPEDRERARLAEHAREWPTGEQAEVTS